MGLKKEKKLQWTINQFTFTTKNNDGRASGGGGDNPYKDMMFWKDKTVELRSSNIPVSSTNASCTHQALDLALQGGRTSNCCSTCLQFLC